MGSGGGGGGRKGRGKKGGGGAVPASSIMEGVSWAGPELVGTVKTDAKYANLLVSGNTYPHKDYLKRAGYEFDGGKWRIMSIPADRRTGIIGSIKETLKYQEGYLKRMNKDVKINIIT